MSSYVFARLQRFIHVIKCLDHSPEENISIGFSKWRTSTFVANFTADAEERSEDQRLAPTAENRDSRKHEVVLSSPLDMVFLLEKPRSRLEDSSNDCSDGADAYKLHPLDNTERRRVPGQASLSPAALGDSGMRC